ncbi:MAG: amidohydrolase family protein [Anaerolineae bacterium]|nr:amidohydrolase family protein [Anaerolineae bacterium]
MPALAFTHAHVFDGTLDGDLQEDVTILVGFEEEGKGAEGTITRIAPSADAELPGGCRVVDLSGKYVIPGFINAHVHLFGDGKPMAIMSASDAKLAVMKKLLSIGPGRAYLKARMKRNAQTALNSGVTTLRTAGDFGYLDVILRDAFAEGTYPGPRLVAAGRSICVTGGHGALMAHVIDNPWDGRKAVRDCLHHGSDVIKILSTGGVMDAKRLGEAGRAQMTVEEIAAICDEAHRGGYKVMTHCESTLGIREALQGGVDSIEHSAPIPDDLIPLFKDNPRAMNGYTTLVATISALMDLCELGREVLKISEIAQQNGEIIRDGMIAGLKTAIEHGIAVAMGTDASVPFVPQYEFWRELVYYQHFAGVSNQHAINIATQQNAKLLGIDDITGTMEAGKSADFVVLDRNPLEDLAALEHVVHVVYRGNVIQEPSYKKVKALEAHKANRYYEKYVANRVT